MYCAVNWLQDIKNVLMRFTSMPCLIVDGSHAYNYLNPYLYSYPTMQNANCKVSVLLTSTFEENESLPVPLWSLDFYYPPVQSENELHPGLTWKCQKGSQHHVSEEQNSTHFCIIFILWQRLPWLYQTLVLKPATRKSWLQFNFICKALFAIQDCHKAAFYKEPKPEIPTQSKPKVTVARKYSLTNRKKPWAEPSSEGEPICFWSALGKQWV